MNKENQKKRGNYGQHGTYVDESISKKCAGEIYAYLDAYEPIDGWEYVLLEKGIREDLYYKRDNVNMPEGFKPSRIDTDIPSIILRSVYNPKDWYLVLSGDDKYQETLGNAIERTSKNYNAVYFKVCNNSDIMPYVIFSSGKAFIDENGKPDSFIMSKFREMFPYIKNGSPHFWSITDKKSSYMKEWNQLYIKRDRFSYEEKKKILLNVAKQSVSYLRDKLQEEKISV